MLAEDILHTTRKLEDTGMDRHQSEAIAETIAAAVAPLATKADLEATNAEIASVKAELKADIASVKAELKTDIASVESGLKADLKAMDSSLREQMATKKDVESAKVWLLGGLLAIALSVLAADLF